jgi:molybdopterin converting factor small subunit
MPTIAAPTLTIRVLLFGSYAERLGLDVLELSFDGPATIADALHRLRSLSGGEAIPARPLCALNLSQVGADAPLSPGAELAILPPLAGG